MENEYGFARMFVISNREYIATEIAKYRTVKSIWNEIVKDKGIKIPYRSFLYNVNTQITENNSVNVHLKNIHAKQKADKQMDKKKAKPVSTTFQFSATSNNEDII